MTLYSGPRPRGARLDGPERALDGFIGLIILIVGLILGSAACVLGWVIMSFN